MNNAGSYYNNASQAGVAQQPQVVSPLGTPHQQSPQIESRKQKRHYPRFQNADLSPGLPHSGYQQPHSPYQQSQSPQPPYQQSQQQFQPPGSPFQQQKQPHQFQPSPQPAYSSPVPTQLAYNGGYNQALNGMANMNMNSVQQPARQDVSLVGQPPLIRDFHREITGPNIPLNVSCSVICILTWFNLFFLLRLLLLLHPIPK